MTLKLTYILLMIMPTCRWQLQLSPLHSHPTEAPSIPDILSSQAYSLPVFFDTIFQFKISRVKTEVLISFSFSFFFKSLWIAAICCSLEALVLLRLTTFTHSRLNGIALVVFLLVFSHQLTDGRLAQCRRVPLPHAS